MNFVRFSAILKSQLLGLADHGRILAPGFWGVCVCVLFFKYTSLAPVQKRARGRCPQMAGVCFFFKYEEVWANLMNVPRLNSSVLCMGMNPYRTSAEARREATFPVCRPAEICMYPFNTQQRQKSHQWTNRRKQRPAKSTKCWSVGGSAGGCAQGRCAAVSTQGLGAQSFLELTLSV